MKQFIEARISLKQGGDAFDIAVARLSELGFDGFLEEEDHLLAYCETEEPDSEKVLHKLHSEGFHEVEINLIGNKNWNAEWESSFAPVQISDELVIRAPFHKPVEGVKYDIIIEPKMSFGTAHHETTYLMLQAILGLDLNKREVLDMGSGTGVLAILAWMKGATQALAIDNDEWAYNNAIENKIRNNADIEVEQGDANSLKGRCFDIIFANINRNILLDDIPKYDAVLNSGGSLLMSGFYTDDLPLITEKCAEAGLEFKASQTKNNWVAAIFIKP
ncbi:MAG: 50S ribosomal protein L11 methyltransferase [Bacteroidales bacterium]|nr:50S ribosomal protein L11 methyltransferase [Bacteroidales bacterium]